DGSAAGTIEFDLNPGTLSASPSSLTRIGSRLGFLVDDPSTFSNDPALWVSDGTAAGTQKLADGAAELASDGVTAYFSKFSPNYALWKGDGTSAGTLPLAAPPGGVFGTTPLAGTLLVRIGDSDVATVDPSTGTVTSLKHITGPLACAP